MSSVTAVPIAPVRRSYLAWLWLGIAAAVAFAVWLAFAGTSAIVAAGLPNDEFLAWHKDQPGIQTTETGLQYQILTPGEGATAGEQDGVVLEIVGTKRDGEEFQPRSPMQFQVGQPMIPGFTEGVKLMSKGAKYRFWLPPELGYGSQPGGPPELSNEILIFEVEMNDLVPAAVIQQMMMQQMMEQQMQGGANGGAPGDAPPGQ